MKILKTQKGERATVTSDPCKRRKKGEDWLNQAKIALSSNRHFNS